MKIVRKGRRFSLKYHSNPTEKEGVNIFSMWKGLLKMLLLHVRPNPASTWKQDKLENLFSPISAYSSVMPKVLRPDRKIAFTTKLCIQVLDKYLFPITTRVAFKLSTVLVWQAFLELVY